MSFLGHISVHETHGIRRFLYPVSLEIPALMLDPVGYLGCGHSCALIMPDGRQIPLQVSPGTTNPESDRRLDFAVSLSPFEKLELRLFSEPSSGAVVYDPLQTVEKERFRSSQQCFSTEFDRCGTLHEVIYDSVSHLRAPASFIRNGRQAALEGASAFAVGYPLGARVTAKGQYHDWCGATTHLETTAYKSWVMLTHLLSRTQPGDELVFNLPFAASSPIVTCDFGVGGGIYGCLRAETSKEIVWRSEFLSPGRVRWSIASGGRPDYVGDVGTAAEYRRQLWFHQIDGHKALAVAITQIPDCCTELKVTLDADGDVAVAFRMGEASDVPMAFGLCCHFLNDIPAISAATSPQSILLPPVVTGDFQCPES